MDETLILTWQKVAGKRKYAIHSVKFIQASEMKIDLRAHWETNTAKSVWPPICAPALVHHLEAVGERKVKVLEQHRNAHFRLEHRHVATEADARAGLEGGKLELAAVHTRQMRRGARGWR
jgi:hypothetical protein